MSEKWTWTQWFGKMDSQMTLLLLVITNRNLWRVASKSVYYSWNSEDEKKIVWIFFFGGGGAMLAYIQEV
jgi:hypothetical protein